MVAKTAPTKAQQIRVELAKIQASGEPLSQKKVIEALAARGIKVSSGHVSMVARHFRRFRRSNAQIVAQEKNGGNKTCVVAPRPNCDELRVAADFAKRCGGLHQAQVLLKELSTLVDPFLST